MKHEFSSLLIDAVKLGYVDVVKYLIEVAKVELGLPVPRNGNDAATLLVQVYSINVCCSLKSITLQLPTTGRRKGAY